MKLEYGKRYVTRGGKVTGPLMVSGYAGYPFQGIVDGEVFSWNDDGFFVKNYKEDLDLVEEYTESPATEPATEPQPGLTKREFMQQFVLGAIKGTHPQLVKDVVAGAEYAWVMIEGKCK